MSLPWIFKTNLATVPNEVPYLHGEPGRLEKWRTELQREREALRPVSGKELNIGIAWQGNPKHRWDRHRSFPLEFFHVLGQMKRVRLHSLQKGTSAAVKAEFAGRYPLLDLGERFNDFADTAAVMRSLDLVIECDSSVIHLAGALGLPVWVALSAMSEWRWMQPYRQTSPWYPTMRLFRQKKLGDWDEVFERMRSEVAKMLECPSKGC